MQCMRCGKEMINTTGGNHNCSHCGFSINDLVYRPTISWNKEDNSSFGQQGWICPVCGRGLAPWVSECSCTSKRWEITCETTTEVR